QHVLFEARLAQNELDKSAPRRKDRQKIATPAVARNLTGIPREIVKRHVERLSRRSIQADYAILPALGNNQCLLIDDDAGGERQAVGQPMAFARKFNEPNGPRGIALQEIPLPSRRAVRCRTVADIEAVFGASDRG